MKIHCLGGQLGLDYLTVLYLTPTECKTVIISHPCRAEIIQLCILPFVLLLIRDGTLGTQPANRGGDSSQPATVVLAYVHLALCHNMAHLLEVLSYT